MSDSEPPELGKKLAFALDPLHIGAGGYQLGRVDNSIVRDPATDVPKIPGTSIAGAIRAYAEIVNKNDGNKWNIDDIFGTKTKPGILRFYDGHLVYFPVNSIYGTVWVTTKELLEYWCKDGEGKDVKLPEELNDEAYVIQGLNAIENLNLGWLLLRVKRADGDGVNIKIPQKISGKNIVVVSEKLFSHIVNDNLEVRTSVRIDSKTGAAKEGALFTYEAIPRGTILGFEIRRDVRKGSENSYISLLNETYSYLKTLGIGGMGTRGFGRLEVFKG